MSVALLGLLGGFTDERNTQWKEENARRAALEDTMKALHFEGIKAAREKYDAEEAAWKRINATATSGEEGIKESLINYAKLYSVENPEKFVEDGKRFFGDKFDHQKAKGWLAEQYEGWKRKTRPEYDWDESMFQLGRAQDDDKIFGPVRKAFGLAPEDDRIRSRPFALAKSDDKESMEAIAQANLEAVGALPKEEPTTPTPSSDGYYPFTYGDDKTSENMGTWIGEARNPDGSSNVVMINYNKKTGQPLKRTVLIDKTPPSAEIEFKKDEREAYTAFLYNEQQKVDNMEDGPERDRMLKLFDLVKKEGDEGPGIIQGVIASRVGQLRSRDSTLDPVAAITKAWAEVVDATPHVLIEEPVLFGLKSKGKAWQNFVLMRDKETGKVGAVPWWKVSDAVKAGHEVVK